MVAFLKSASWLGGLLTIIALIIMLLRQVIAFIGFLTTIIQVAIVVFFVLLFVGVGYLIFRDYQRRKRNNS